jgi:hypothetical protein
VAVPLCPSHARRIRYDLPATFLGACRWAATDEAAAYGDFGGGGDYYMDDGYGNADDDSEADRAPDQPAGAAPVGGSDRTPPDESVPQPDGPNRDEGAVAARGGEDESAGPLLGATAEQAATTATGPGSRAAGLEDDYSGPAGQGGGGDTFFGDGGGAAAAAPGGGALSVLDLLNPMAAMAGMGPMGALGHIGPMGALGAMPGLPMPGLLPGGMPSLVPGGMLGMGMGPSLGGGSGGGGGASSRGGAAMGAAAGVASGGEGKPFGGAPGGHRTTRDGGRDDARDGARLER